MAYPLNQPTLNFNQLLAQLSQGGLGAPSSTPPPTGMSPSMPWMGAPQGYFDPLGTYPSDPSMDSVYGPLQPAMPEPAGLGPPDMGYARQSLQQAQGQPQQAPTGHPVLDRLLSSDPHEQAMAAAIFARGFVRPDEAINWAMQMRSQRQAQQARFEQAKMEKEMTKASTDYKRREDRVIKSWTNARDKGVLNEVEATIGKPWTDWDEEDARKADLIASDEVHRIKAAQDEVTRVKLRDDARVKTMKEAYQFGQWPKRKEAELDDPDFAAVLNTVKAMGEDKRARDKEIQSLTAQARRLQLRVAAREDADPTRKDRLRVILDEANDIDGALKATQNDIDAILQNQDFFGDPEMGAAQLVQKRTELEQLMQQYRDKMREAGVTASGGSTTKPTTEGKRGLSKSTIDKVLGLGQ